MKTTILMRSIAVLMLAGLVHGVQANSFGFEQSTVTTQSDTFSVSFAYDFTDFGMFGGRVNIIYDPTEIEFTGFVDVLLPTDAELATTHHGILTEPGLIGDIGVVASFDLSQGINSASRLGTFTFRFIGSGSGNTPCGATLCMFPSGVNPFISLVGHDVTGEILGQGILSVQVTQVPVPAAIGLMFSALGLLVGLGFKPR